MIVLRVWKENYLAGAVEELGIHMQPAGDWYKTIFFFSKY